MNDVDVVRDDRTLAIDRFLILGEFPRCVATSHDFSPGAKRSSLDTGYYISEYNSLGTSQKFEKSGTSILDFYT